jgi:Uma2 family endonuclease
MAAVLNRSEPTTQKVILHDISWETYERLLAEHQEGSSTRFAYDRGMLEIRILSLGHERFKERLMRLVGVIAEELEIDIEGVGSTTFRREDLARGFEPDACYYLTGNVGDSVLWLTDPPGDIY